MTHEYEANWLNNRGNHKKLKLDEMNSYSSVKL